MIARCIEEAHVGFCYAIRLHPAMKYVAPVRRSLAIRTIFNLLGPMINPARVKRQIIGTPNADLAKTLAGAMARLDTTHAMIIHGCDGLCDISIGGPTIIHEIKNDKIETYTVHPSDFGIEVSSFDSILIDSPQQSAEVIRGILDGKVGPARDIACLNAAAGLVIADRARNLAEGLEQARESIDSGNAKLALEKLVEISNS